MLEHLRLKGSPEYLLEVNTNLIVLPVLRHVEVK